MLIRHHGIMLPNSGVHFVSLIYCCSRSRYKLSVEKVAFFSAFGLWFLGSCKKWGRACIITGFFCISIKLSTNIPHISSLPIDLFVHAPEILSVSNASSLEFADNKDSTLKKGTFLRFATVIKCQKWKKMCQALFEASDT